MPKHIMIKKEIKSEITINSTPKIVWEYLTNFAMYAEWNPFILSVSGELKELAKLKIKIKPYNSAPMNFNPTILKVETDKEIRWIGRLFIKGLFDGEHYFKLIDNGNKTTLIQGETFSGIFIPLMKNMIEVKTLTGFKLMNEQLKKLIELSDRS